MGQYVGDGPSVYRCNLGFCVEPIWGSVLGHNGISATAVSQEVPVWCYLSTFTADQVVIVVNWVGGAKVWGFDLGLSHLGVSTRT